MCGANAKAVSNGSSVNAELPKPANFNRLRIGDFGKIICLAFSSSVRSAFSFHIGHIFEMGSEPEMVRVYAKAVIPTGAIMQNVHSFGYGTVVDNPRDDMRPQSFRSPRIRLPENEHHSIFAFQIRSIADRQGSRPQPAGLRFVDLGPEAFYDGWRKALLCQKLRSNLDHVSQFARSALLGLAELFVYIKSTTKSQFGFGAKVLGWVARVVASGPPSFAERPICR